MTRTEELIATLSTDPHPIPRPGARLAAAMLAGWALALAGLALVLGSPLEPVAERGIAASALKLGYPLTIAAIAAAAALAAGRPGARFEPRLSLFAVPLLLVALFAAADLASAPAGARVELLFGSTFGFCIAAVTIASIPAFVAMVWAFRVLAPIRLPAAGFLIGLSAGGISATAYALYCPEASPAFLLAAYTPAILIPALVGATSGRRLMRW